MARISNVGGVPAPMVAAIVGMSSKYHKGGADFSVTELLQPAHYRRLKIEHAEEIIEDVQDLLYRIDGQADHAVVEAAELPDGLSEERLTVTIDGVRISGAVDVYHDGIIYDLKRCSVWSTMTGPKDEWIQQLNIYAYLYRQAGFPVRGLSILARYRDWSKTKARFDSGNYPKRGLQEFPLPIWTDEECLTFMRERIAAHLDIKTASKHECSPEERWAKPPTYAAMKTGRKSAVRLCETREEAQVFVDSGAATHIDHRPGEDMRCGEYCAVAQWCTYFQKTYPQELVAKQQEYQDMMKAEVK